MSVVNITDRLPHDAIYVACMECGHDWVAVIPTASQSKDAIECSKCGAMAGERVQYDDPVWFTRFMKGETSPFGRRTLVLLNAKQISEREK